MDLTESQFIEEVHKLVNDHVGPTQLTDKIKTLCSDAWKFGFSPRDVLNEVFLSNGSKHHRKL